MDCCGAINFIDWLTIEAIKNNSIKIPETVNPLTFYEDIEKTHRDELEESIGNKKHLVNILMVTFKESSKTGKLPVSCCIIPGNGDYCHWVPSVTKVNEIRQQVEKLKYFYHVQWKKISGLSAEIENIY